MPPASPQEVIWTVSPHSKISEVIDAFRKWADPNLPHPDTRLSGLEYFIEHCQGDYLLLDDLLGAGANPLLRDGRALMRAADREDLEERLQRRCLSYALVDETGGNIFHWAIRKLYTALDFERLTDLSCRENATLRLSTTPDHRGNTPLHLLWHPKSPLSFQIGCGSMPEKVASSYLWLATPFLLSIDALSQANDEHHTPLDYMRMHVEKGRSLPDIQDLPEHEDVAYLLAQVQHMKMHLTSPAARLASSRRSL